MTLEESWRLRVLATPKPHGPHPSLANPRWLESTRSIHSVRGLRCHVNPLYTAGSDYMKVQMLLVLLQSTILPSTRRKYLMHSSWVATWTPKKPRICVYITKTRFEAARPRYSAEWKTTCDPRRITSRRRVHRLRPISDPPQSCLLWMTPRSLKWMALLRPRPVPARQ